MSEYRWQVKDSTVATVIDELYALYAPRIDVLKRVSEEVSIGRISPPETSRDTKSVYRNNNRFAIHKSSDDPFDIEYTIVTRLNIKSFADKFNGLFKAKRVVFNWQTYEHQHELLARFEEKIRTETNWKVRVYQDSTHMAFSTVVFTGAFKRTFEL